MSLAGDAPPNGAENNSFLSILREAVWGSERDFTTGPLGTAIFILAVPMIIETETGDDATPPTTDAESVQDYYARIAPVLQVLTIAHVYGHNDFFKNNFTFKTTQAEFTLGTFKAHAERVHRSGRR